MSTALLVSADRLNVFQWHKIKVMHFSTAAGTSPKGNSGVSERWSFCQWWFQNGETVVTKVMRKLTTDWNNCTAFFSFLLWNHPKCILVLCVTRDIVSLSVCTKLGITLSPADRQILACSDILVSLVLLFLASSVLCSVFWVGEGARECAGERVCKRKEQRRGEHFAQLE